MKIETQCKHFNLNIKMKNSKLYALLFASIVFIAVLIVMWIAFDQGENLGTSDPSMVNWRLNFWHQILIATATSLLSSIIFYLVYSMVVEKPILNSVIEEASISASAFSLSLFNSRYDRILPNKVFQPTPFPTQEFNKEFESILNSTTNFQYKGDTASYTSYRLSQLAESRTLLSKEIKIIMLDPREVHLVEDRAKTELTGQSYTKQMLQEATAELQMKIYISIMAFFDICHMNPIKIAFHDDHIFFRSEILDESLFLTYCLGGEYPVTHLYQKKSLPFEAFCLDFQQTWSSAHKMLELNSKLTENDICDYLKSLGCKISMNDLRKNVTIRFKNHKSNKLAIL